MPVTRHRNPQKSLTDIQIEIDSLYAKHIEHTGSLAGIVAKQKELQQLKNLTKEKEERGSRVDGVKGAGRDSTGRYKAFGSAGTEKRRQWREDIDKNPNIIWEVMKEKHRCEACRKGEITQCLRTIESTISTRRTQEKVPKGYTLYSRCQACKTGCKACTTVKVENLVLKEAPAAIGSLSTKNHGEDFRNSVQARTSARKVKSERFVDLDAAHYLAPPIQGTSTSAHQNGNQLSDLEEAIQKLARSQMSLHAVQESQVETQQKILAAINRLEQRR
ncbi:hypothetical protein DFP72DRAFT_1058091 [Ephemerocybe angulata]|uniref:Uncharacterized protein n=1 Tax=Ephemerocybe angulata TaxID=980116 RepID=A0A8H6IJC5_9AGAR|nr:hypothetical protein DFP72DRAFT_1058091 [Tulosesus angulatus]